MKKPATLTLLIVLYKFASIVNFFKYIYIYIYRYRFPSGVVKISPEETQVTSLTNCGRSVEKCNNNRMPYDDTQQFST